MELIEKTFVLTIPTILTRSSARRSAARIPTDVSLVLFDFSSNSVMFRSGASELVRLTLVGQWRTATIKGWEQLGDLNPLYEALHKENVFHQFTQ